MKFQFTQNVTSGLFWIGLFKTFGQLFIWVNTISIAHFLNPADYGLVAMASLLTTFILLIGDFGFGSSIIQKKELHMIHVYSLFWIAATVGIGFLLVVYFGAPWYAGFFNNVEIIPILQLSTVAFFFNIIADVPNQLILKNLRYKTTGLIDFTSNLVASISVLVFAIRGFGAYSLVFGSIITGVLKFSLACWFGRWFPQAQFQRQGLRGYFKFGGALVIDRILWYAYSNADFIILAKRLGQVPFGLYSFALNLATIPTSKLQPILYPVLFSSFSKIQEDLPQLRAHYLKIIDFVFTLYAMIYCGIFWVIPEFVKIFLGPKWEPIIPVIRILLLIQPLRAVSSLSPSLINALGRPGVGAKNMVIFVALMIPSFFLASQWGMMGVAYVWCTVYPVAFFITLTQTNRVSGITLPQYVAQLVSGLKLSVLTSIVIFTFRFFLEQLYPTRNLVFLWLNFGGTIGVGIIVNAAGLWFLERRYLTMIWTLFKR